MELKTLTAPVVIKDADKGEVEAVVATLGVVDRDGDVILGIRGGNRVKLSGWGHDVVLQQAPPVGIGSITAENNKAVFRGQFFLNTERGREAFEVVKAMGDDAEWSFGFPRSEAVLGELTEAWRAAGARTVYREVTPTEASPVFSPAGHGTRTIGIKYADADAAEQRELAAIEDAMVGRETLARLERAKAVDRMLLNPPSIEHGVVAKFSADIAARLLYCRDRAPEVAWMVVPPGDQMTGWMHLDDPNRVWVARDISLAETVKTVLHETHHVIVHRDYERKSVGEAFATEFENTWAYPIWRGGEATGWKADKVHIVDKDRAEVLGRSDRERLGIKRGDIVLCRGTATAWQWAGASWSRA